jgi:hypothetical protein
VNQAAEYRTNAEICRRMADRAQTEEDRRAWLDMAQSWSFLTKLEDVVPTEEIETAERDNSQFNVIARGTYSDASLALARMVNRLRAKLNSTYSSVLRLLKSSWRDVK